MNERDLISKSGLRGCGRGQCVWEARVWGLSAAHHSFSAAPSPLLCAPRSCAPPSFHLTSLCPPALPPPAPRCPCCRLGEIQNVAGQAAPRQEVLDALVGGDFDPEEYDRQMAAAFGEDYYGAVSALGRLAVGAHCSV